MKKIFLLLSTACLLFIACDKVEPFDDGTYKTTPDIDEGGDSIPSVILFEFTGWNCTNCPDGHDVIHDIEKNYPVHTIAIHAGFFADPGNTGPDFRCEVSNDFYEQMTPNSLPSGSVNSMNFRNLKDYTDWATLVDAAYEESNKNPQVFITMEESHTDTTITAKVSLEFAEDIMGKYNLSVYVVENGISAPQNDHGTIVYDYIHNHVLRASMYNSIIGELVGENPTIGTKIEKQYTLDIDTEWVADSLHLIPFIYNTETNIVIPTKIIKPKTE